jgi:hypothetical protein
MHCLFAFFLKETGGAKAPSVIYLKRKEKTRSTTKFTKNKGEITTGQAELLLPEWKGN